MGKFEQRQRLKDHTEIIENFCYEYDFEFEIIQEWHLRVRGNKKVIDFFPMKKSYHDIKENYRGSYYDIFKFLDKFFNVNSF